MGAGPQEAIFLPHCSDLILQQVLCQEPEHQVGWGSRFTVFALTGVKVLQLSELSSFPQMQLITCVLGILRIEGMYVKNLERS